MSEEIENGEVENVEPEQTGRKRPGAVDSAFVGNVREVVLGLCFLRDSGTCGALRERRVKTCAASYLTRDEGDG